MIGRDLLLIAVSLTGIAGGVTMPEMASVFSPYILQNMMVILFLSFLRLNFDALWGLDGGALFEVAAWSLWKLLIMPIILWAVCRLVVPDYSLAILLLAGVSAGVTAPFFAGLLGANVERVLQVVVVTSLLVPLTLPTLAQLLMGEELSIPYWPMVRLLLLVIFMPLGASIAMRRFLPAAIPCLARIQFPLMLALFLTINLGVFANYAAFLRTHLGEMAMILMVCCVGALAFTGSGFLLGRLSGGRLNGLDGAVLMTYVNNVLIVVFAARFFGPTEPLMAAAYMLPLNIMLLPIRFAVQSETRFRRHHHRDSTPT